MVMIGAYAMLKVQGVQGIQYRILLKQLLL
jgi:hypothetical protein